MYGNDFGSLQAAQHANDAQSAANYFGAIHAGQSQQGIDQQARAADDAYNRYWNDFADKQQTDAENRPLKLHALASEDRKLAMAEGDQSFRQGKYFTLQQNEADQAAKLRRDEFNFKKSQTEDNTDNAGDALATEFGDAYQAKQDADTAYSDAMDARNLIDQQAAGKARQNKQGLFEPIAIGGDTGIVDTLNKQLRITNAALDKAEQAKKEADRIYFQTHTNVAKNGFSIDDQNGQLIHRHSGKTFSFLPDTGDAEALAMFNSIPNPDAAPTPAPSPAQSQSPVSANQYFDLNAAPVFIPPPVTPAPQEPAIVDNPTFYKAENQRLQQQLVAPLAAQYFNNPQSNQPSPAPTVDPSVTPVKPLTSALARQFLNQARGDKNRARQLAAEAGYSF